VYTIFKIIVVYCSLAVLKCIFSRSNKTLATPRLVSFRDLIQIFQQASLTLSPEGDSFFHALGQWEQSKKEAGNERGLGSDLMCRLLAFFDLPLPVPSSPNSGPFMSCSHSPQIKRPKTHPCHLAVQF